MKKLLYLSLVTCCLSLTLAGCTTMSGSSSYSGSDDTSLDVAAMLRLNDVPVPAGFKVLNTESFAFQNDVTRVALLKYTGSKAADQVVAFYKQQMPMYKWNAINIIEYERRMLNYEKSGESCIVTIEGKGRKSILTIAISPKSRPMKVEFKEN